MNRQEFNKKIQNEYETFVEETLKLSPKEIFEKSNEITIKTFLTTYLQENNSINTRAINSINELGNNVLKTLYDNFANSDPEFFYLDICEDILSDYLSMFEDEEDYSELD